MIKINTLQVIGRIIDAPRILKDCHGQNLARFHLAVERDFPTNDGRLAYDILPFCAKNKQAKVLQEESKLGRRVAITGSMHSKKILDDRDVPMLECLAQHIQWLDTNEE